MLGLILAGLAALIIGFGLKKIDPLVGGFLCGLAYFLFSLCSVASLAGGLRGAAGGDETVAMVTALFTEGIMAGVISAICAIVIWGIRKLR